jgi:hypothetical protein
LIRASGARTRPVAANELTTRAIMRITVWLLVVGAALRLPLATLAAGGGSHAAQPAGALERATAAIDSLWSTFWSPGAAYLRRDAAAKFVPMEGLGTSQAHSVVASSAAPTPPPPPLLPYWNYQEATHAMAAAASLDFAKYGPRLAAMVAGQGAMDSARQAGTGTGPGPAGSDGWTREYFDDMNWVGWHAVGFFLVLTPSFSRRPLPPTPFLLNTRTRTSTSACVHA